MTSFFPILVKRNLTQILLFFSISFLVILAGCNKSESGGSDARSNELFEKYAASFIEALWKQNPDWATNAGYHKYDSVLVVPDSKSVQSSLKFAKQHLDSLEGFNAEELSPSNKTDFYLIRNLLKENLWSLDTLKSYQWDPSSFNVSSSFAFILNEKYAPLEERLLSIKAKLINVPDYYKAAKKSVSNPVPDLLTLAIEQNLGGVSVFEKDLVDSVKVSSLAEGDKIQIIQRAGAAAAAMKDYAKWLKELKIEKPRSFRLGKDLYARKFAHNIQSAYTADQIYDSAVARKEEVQSKMAVISRQLWPKYFGTKPMPADSLELIGKMIDTLSVNHVKQQDFQTAISDIIPSLIRFINDKKLIDLDPTKPLIVRKEPAYMAGVAGASISAPGPYDKGGNTYYNVGSIANWPKDKAESYLREYNHYIMQILDIHEAIPGHYTQLVYANRSPSLIKSLLGNGAMIEGWAVYTEQMMLENGFGNNQPEMWLMWYKWHLRAVCNTILDYSVHSGQMTKEEALHLLTKEAFQQQAEAEGKWRRVSVSNVQLTSYYTGYKEIIDLRSAYKAKAGDKFDLKSFHEKFLSYGSAPVKYIRALMLGKE
ncbi:Uncharacterized conserved protein, DUF885 familyt [Dyadobacter koreensis]|uniref:Uncharacterized conserved protein, DUF885 familyt n=1 Tax=Dyadobacter koreensis TaxID=408657 RepID=A0A1H6PZJ1_9BACT|nr:DUF885 domain-containing protein [Dyadobacter koreensis]SEI37049.1 Uncharacterized conserved protein, DUF885 familyt [Dyadobacter koreensis]